MREYRDVVDRDGRIFHDGSEIIDPLVLRFFLRAMQRSDDGRYLVLCQHAALEDGRSGGALEARAAIHPDAGAGGPRSGLFGLAARRRALARLGATVTIRRAPPSQGNHGKISTMKTTIDAAGRLVIPKEIRREAGLKPGVLLEVRLRDGRIEIEPAPLPVKLVRKGKLLVAVPERNVGVLTSETVERTRRALRRERAERF